MQRRQELIRQVKEEYARRADLESRQTFTSMAGSPPTEAYYERLLGEVLRGIDEGRFDGFDTGRDIVEAVAANHRKWGIV